MTTRIILTLAMSLLLTTSWGATTLNSNTGKPTLVDYSITINGEFSIWMDKLIPHEKSYDYVLEICKSLDGIYHYKEDECYVTDLPKYIKGIGQHLVYKYHDNDHFNN